MHKQQNGEHNGAQKRVEYYKKSSPRAAAKSSRVTPTDEVTSQQLQTQGSGVEWRYSSNDSKPSSHQIAGSMPPTSEIRVRKRQEQRIDEHVELSHVTKHTTAHNASSSDGKAGVIGGEACGQGNNAQGGHGHQFVSANLRSPTWCDKCGDFIWGVYKQCLICTNCHFTCHEMCHPLVTLDCSEFASRPNYDGVIQTETSFTASSCKEAVNCTASDNSVFHRSPSKRRWIFDSLKAHALFYSGVTEKETESDSGYHTACRTVLPNNYRKRVPGQHTLTREDLHRRISAFNTNNHGLIMEMPTGDSNTFQGFIRVHMNLIRPINMCISLDPPTLHDICANPDSQQSSSATMKNMQVTSFYLPKDTTKVIHISSRTTTEEVIQVLLAKYHITDNPRKFALYEKTQEHNKTAVLRRLLDDEVPLQICLSWTSEGVECLDHNQFVLQENDTGEILWEAFSLPELENFLVVLNREEEEYINQVNSKYRLLKVQMTKRLQKIEPKKKKVPTATLR